jgi:four helix bundle protein
VRTHLDLDVWKKAIQFVKKIYEVTSKFPDTEKYGLASQMRRCAVSIPSNIAEGAGRNSKKEFKQFLYISVGSLSELETQLIISTELNYQVDNSLLGELNEIRKMLFGLINSIKI